MTLKERYTGIIGWFSVNRPSAKSELNYSSPFELLVAVILSAQCTDKRVNLVTPELFRRFPDPESMAGADFDTLFPYIRSVSYPNSKTTHLLEMSRKLVSSFGGEVPSETEELMSLPGVGRKTANVIASIIFGKPLIAVDTHVFRVSRRLGLSKGKTVEAVEKDLTRHIPAELRPIAHHWLILHGRYTCTAKSPKCSGCPLLQWCAEASRSKIREQKRMLPE